MKKVKVRGTLTKKKGLKSKLKYKYFILGYIMVLAGTLITNTTMVNRKNKEDFQTDVIQVIDTIAYKYGYEETVESYTDMIELQGKKNYIERQKLSLSDAERYLEVKPYKRYNEEELTKIFLSNIIVILGLLEMVSSGWTHYALVKDKNQKNDTQPTNYTSKG